MRIGIDARLVNETGVGRYIKNLIYELQKIDTLNEYFIYLPEKAFQCVDITAGNFKKRKLNTSWHSISEQIVVPAVFLRDRIDVAHFPYFTVPILYRNKYVLTVHDLIVDHFDTGKASTKSFFIYKLKRILYKLVMTNAVRRAEIITTISHATKDEVLSHYAPRNPNIHVTYDGLDSNFESIYRSHRPKKIFPFEYILYVGNAYPHKNLENLVRALFHFKSSMKLVLAGDDPYFYKRLKQFVRRKKMQRRVVFFGYANDYDLIDLYSFARCLVFPSFMEGFGLPNLEAVHCGILPVVSDIPVFREIWGDTLVYFNPNDHRDIANKLNAVVSLPTTEIEKKIVSAKKIERQYRFKDMAMLTLDLYNKIK